ncbi:hypothetical protein NW762_005453 [Fusarium torreyae]|uniref:BZIP domain-containing protein n=1 Tax=Fusarium torreyae TaxID=1237075 RepID=A0A9W8VIL9_9HYPO|nr:hypothetical protein NW762_005453 [Fusarium torreyae]
MDEIQAEPRSRKSRKSMPDDKKRIRNRLSQQAYRRRQAVLLEDLRQKADAQNKPESEVIDSLRRENSRLRDHLLEVKAKLARVQTTLDELSGSVSSVIGETSQRQSNHDRADAEITSSAVENQQDPSLDGFLDRVTDLDLPILDTSQTLLEDSNVCEQNEEMSLAKAVDGPDDYALFIETQQHESIGKVPPDETSQAVASSLTWQIPNIWNFDYQMGPQAYSDAISRSRDANSMRSKPWLETNSPFSDHIDVLQQLLKSKMGLLRLDTGQPYHLFYTRVLMALSLFNSMNRADAMVWYAKTRFYHIVDLTAWQMLPCPQTLNRVFERYRPTKLQLLKPHPIVIDWIPFPSIRDRLIELHASNPKIDQIVCDAVSSYVVEAWMSDLVLNAPRVRAYIRVNDLISNVPSDAEPGGLDLSFSLPAKSPEALFSSPDCSEAVFKLLNMNRGASYYKVDPALFGKYPELYDQSVDIVAQGIPLRPTIQPVLSSPRRLDVPTFEVYRSFVDFSVSAPLDIAG